MGWSEVATSQGKPGGTGNRKDKEGFSPEALEGARLCQHLNFKLLTSRTVRGYIFEKDKASLHPPLFPSSFSPLLFIKYQLHDKHSVNEKTDMLLAFMKLTFSGERREGGMWGEGRGEAAFF